jgi:PHP family Zn ribbon phosphoesterase
VERLGNEYSVLLDASKAELYETVEAKVAEAILNVRAGKLTVVPGFDGVYGKLVLGESSSSDLPRLVKRSGIVQQSSLGDFW